MAQSKAHIKASNKYRDKTYKMIQITCKPEQADFIRSAAAAEGLSITQYILRRVLPEELQTGQKTSTKTDEKE